MTTESIRLRTMTWKSILSNGKFQGCSVRMAYEAEGKEGPSYLAWLYYRCSTINFCDEILDAIDITPDLRIAKPGVAGYMYNVWKKHYYDIHYANLSENALMGRVQHHKAQTRNKYKAKHRQIECSLDYTKSQMQARNQAPKFLKQ